MIARPMAATLADLLHRAPDRILLRVTSGSHAYGLATQGSDRDERGVFALPAADYLSLSEPVEHLQDERGDAVYYGLRKFLALATAANPSALELLFTPADCILQEAEAWAAVHEARDRFVTTRCLDSHVGYARAQIQRARGQNKWINNPQPETQPRREDYCYVILGPWPGAPQGASMPLRPRPLADAGIDLREFHCAALEHVPRTFRLYHYGKGAKGVFRDGNLVCESIPREHEATHLRGLLVYDQPGFEQALRDHGHYWQWRKLRNEARWRTQEAGEIDYDAKNMMHTFRLLMAAEAIVTEGRPRVRLHGADRAFLLQVRAGAFAWQELVERAEAKVADLVALVDASPLPAAPDAAFVDQLLRTVTQSWEQGRA